MDLQSFFLENIKGHETEKVTKQRKSLFQIDF